MSSMVMRYPGGRPKALTLSYDDGVQQDIRLIDIMKKNGLKGAFNFNTGCYAAEDRVYPPDKVHRRMKKSEALALYTDSGMEVAVHGLTHPYLQELSKEACTYDVMKDRENLEEQFGRIVRGMAYPYGTTSDRVVQCLESCGIVYSRTTVSTCKFELPAQWLRWHPTCHHRDPRLMELAERFVGAFKGRESWLFYLWGHSYEFDGDKNWEVIERFAEYVGGRDDIWYATNMEIYEYVEAYRKLVTSLDCRRVYNPTALDIWVEINEKLYCVEAGRELAVE